MRFTTVILGLSAVISSATARDSITIKICDGRALAGDCISPSIGIQHECHNLFDTPVNGNVRSVKIPTGYRCRFWQSNGCNGGGTGDIQAPGVDDVSYPRSQSVKCYKN
ncbi:hypothetical protein N7463_010643 [Penicillium fimorum]|uniref:Uncharacterized protein n=1 Tax=Penicillium fimorum TaxID=1882269 RepID=A0A9W9XKA5_9EURO|nr:hypothetical protein N7463_010643 [Penicillium fimorum]